MFQNFANISAQAACVSAVITPDNCAHEMERLIATARAESRPAYLLVASDRARGQFPALGVLSGVRNFAAHDPLRRQSGNTEGRQEANKSEPHL